MADRQPIFHWPMEEGKSTEIRRFRRLQQIGRLLRCFEAAGVIFLLSYSSSYVQAAARYSGEFLRRAASVLVSPASVFLIGNTIVLVLFAKSGKISSASSSISETESEDASGGGEPAILSGDVCSDLSYPPPTHLGPAEEVVFEDKAVCVEIRACSRSQSERFDRIREERKLRRAETDVGRPLTAHDKGRALAQDNVEDEDDSEQFRRTIEEFIAKQQQFQREESLAVISYSVRLAEPVAV
ncbi:hypothetical protein AXF42_Ash003223 [Apostasia shenzhenica]|uniref:DUF4408 domain-containing protein n=1 Tax=Apostasia shenzhenica TaxID=1088818 RepID=A0A2I0BFK7_9ASPA|nr:hypothetical protein AXF42_Ash003223 [Apostasia shenzhenica]